MNPAYWIFQFVLNVAVVAFGLLVLFAVLNYFEGTRR